MKPEFLPKPAGYSKSDARHSEPLQLRSFAEWSNDGFKILKGSRHIKRDATGVPLFSSAQVEKCFGIESIDEDFDEEYDPDLPGNPEDYGYKD